jgi:hypothetical protein
MAGLALPERSLAQAPAASIDVAQSRTATAKPAGDWEMSFTPYGWIAFLSGSQTVKGRTATIDTNVFQMFSQS